MKKASIAFLFFLLFAFTIRAQYPFEKYKAIQYKRVAFKKSFSKDSSKIYLKAKLPGIDNGKSKYSIIIEGENENVPDIGVTIYIKKNGKTIQKIIDKKGFSIWGLESGYLYIADIKSDSLNDIKITINNPGNGIWYLYRERIYLFQTKDGKFRKLSYRDWDVNNIHQEDDDTINYWPERDFDNDGNFEIITCDFQQGYKNHSYWIFDVYKYIDGNLVNVDDKYGYPIMIQYLYRDNYQVTKRISPEKMKTFKLEKPDEYDSR